MKKLTFLFGAAFCMALLPATAQTAQFYKDRSDSFYSVLQYDSALYYARLAEPSIVDTFSKNSVQYAWFVGQFYSMNYESLSNLDSATYWYDYSLRLFEALHDTTSGQYGETLINYGNMLTRMGSFTKSFPYLQKGVIVSSRYPGELNGYLGSRNNLANYYQYTGDYLKAELLYQEVLEAIRQNPGKISAYKHSIVLLNLAEVNHKCGYTQMAEKYFEQGLDSLQNNSTVKDKYYEALNNYATLCIAQNKTGVAKKVLEKALNDPYFKSFAAGNVQENAASAYALALSCLGNVYLAENNKSGAEFLYKQSIRVTENMFILPYLKYTTLANLARLYTSTKKFYKADSVYNKIIPQLDTQPDRDNYAYTKIYGDYCENLLHLHQTEKAATIIRDFTTTLLQVMDRNIGGMSEAKQMRYIASLERYINLMFSAIANGNPDGELVTYSLNKLLHLKGLVLNMQLQKAISLRASADSGLYQLNKQLRMVKEALYYEYINKEKNQSFVDSLQLLAGNYESKISAATGFLYEAGNTTPADDVQARLTKGCAAVEFVCYTNALTGNKTYGAFVTRYGKHPAVFIQLFAEQKLISCFTNASGKNFDPENQLDNTQLIYRFAWKPLVPYLSDIDTIYYSPAGLLNYVAFDAITSTPGSYLLHKKNLLLLSSTRSLLNSRSYNNKIAAAVVWGNIDCSVKAYTAKNIEKPKPFYANPGLPDDVRKGGNGVAFPPLPPDEVPEIVKLVKQKKVKLMLYEKDEATEDNFKQDAVTYSGLLHISTHGYYYDQLEAKYTNATDSNAFRTHINPLLRCGLILKGGNYAWSGKKTLPGTEDGILTGYEIAMMNLSKINLVVLSACETGLGDMDAGSEGILGLQRAFKMAGVQNMVLSLWNVNAKFTKQLMTLFYMHLLNGTTPATALQKAKKQMAKNNPPYTWAGFVLVE